MVGMGGSNSHSKLIKPPLTVSAGVGAANGGNWCAAGHSKLIKPPLTVSAVLVPQMAGMGAPPVTINL